MFEITSLILDQKKHHYYILRALSSAWDIFFQKEIGFRPDFLATPDYQAATYIKSSA